MCRDLQQQTRLFDGVLCRAGIMVNIADGGDPKAAAAEIISGTYFPVLGVGPELGRVIEEQDDEHAPGLEIFLNKENAMNWSHFELELCIPVRKLTGRLYI